MTNPIIDESGNQMWFNSAGEIHREDGPALMGIDGGKAWCINGDLHREDGPAQEFANGEKHWWINGKKIQ